MKSKIKEKGAPVVPHHTAGYEYNQEVIMKKPVSFPAEKIALNQQSRRGIEAGVVKMYMEYYDQVIKDHITANNENLYTSMTNFLHSSSKQLGQVSAMVAATKGIIVEHSAFNVKKENASQIPTCLVITSSESASSIETQFDAVADKLVRSIQSVSIVLDEKKCGNMKQTIDFIVDKLRASFELNREDVKNRM